MNLTPVQARIHQVLQDGEEHSIVELHKCLWDDQSSLKAVFKHITNLRTVVHRQGMAITRRTVEGVVHYRLTRHISTS